MLPATLLELISQRISASAPAVQVRYHALGRARSLHQLALQHAPPVGHTPEIQLLKTPHRGGEKNAQGHDLRTARQAEVHAQIVSEFEARIAALQSMGPLLKTNEEIESPSHYEEAQLRDIYQDLLAFPEEATSNHKISKSDTTVAPSSIQIIESLEARLSAFETTIAPLPNSSLSAQLQAERVRTVPGDQESDLVPLQPGTSPLSSRLRSIINRLGTFFDKWTANMVTETTATPLGLISTSEWDYLLKACLEVNDTLASERVLAVMKRSGMAPSDEQYDIPLDWYAVNGMVEQADTYFSRLNIDVPRDRQRDLCIKARVKAGRLDDACALIHSLEAQATPAPMQSYTRVIQALLRQSGPGSELLKAQAWDMFSHMRYVAHAIPDEFMYSVMIRSIAESSDPEAERALDLFTEMTVDHGITPTNFSYNAVILVCARSKNMKLEAFRLAREMLTAHRNAFGETPSRLRPDKYTFIALLDAAKRMGDLPRTRWILAQMVQEARNPRGIGTRCIDSRVMKHVFQSYASYRPPFRKNVLTERLSTENKLPEEENAQPEMLIPPSSDTSVQATRRPRSYTPQTHQEVIKEATRLWERVLEDQPSGQPRDGDRRPVFSNVTLNTDLANAYMAVFFAHSPPEASFKVFGEVYDSLDIPRNAESYILALTTYTNGKRSTKSELRTALDLARGVWDSWLRLESSGVAQMSLAQPKSTVVDARLVEKAWVGMLRLLTLNGRLDEAVELLRRFVERYPPALVKQASPPHPMRSPRVILYADRPLVRLTERSSVPEDRITPFLTFVDIELLHQRAVAMRRHKHIAYITWVGRAYEGSLRKRRDETFKSVYKKSPETTT
ncbi:hypothetical protein BU17DRAFT_68997 [Hysterangium stoloniferum]|nr:hypothetical protein BU17DRAFT_68997 [Hysterangium stoloniferum]